MTRFWVSGFLNDPISPGSVPSKIASWWTAYEALQEIHHAKPDNCGSRTTEKSGKTTALCKAYRRFCDRDDIKWLYIGYVRKDVKRVVVQVGDYKIAFNSPGDDPKELKNDLEFFVKHWQCDVIVCACRRCENIARLAKTGQVVENFAKDPSILKWVNKWRVPDADKEGQQRADEEAITQILEHIYTMVPEPHLVEA